MLPEEAVRRLRLQTLQATGVDPYPATTQRTHQTTELLSRFDELSAAGRVVTVVGRVRTLRKHGGLTFLQIEDGSGSIQCALKRDTVGQDRYDFFHATTDMGDFLEFSGTLFLTKKGEKTLDVSIGRILTKSLLPMPEKWHGLSDTETRYRQRYLDLMVNPPVRNIFRVRARILSTMRSFLDQAGFLEVETPVLQAVPGGANAEPFKTHHNALNQDMYLRVAPELFLKRCVVGGFERVYEVSRCFRNEGIDHSHNPEFTQVEAYAAYMDYRQLMDFVEAMLLKIIKEVGSDPAAVPFQGHVMDFAKPIERLTYAQALRDYADIELSTLGTRDEAAFVAAKRRVPVEKTDGKATIIDRIYKHLVRPKLIQPVFLMDYPTELSPLAKRKPEDPSLVEMFQLVYGGGVENVKAFSELNDPLNQEERFAEQEAARSAGDKEAQFGDADFVTALKHGMPPTAGFGIGIDRLTATLVDASNLKEVILFPTLRN
ncbi:lysine--tRNA ligase [Candidatus Uhrbacteria bacterium]|nr:lysine--tRNA ligase [Candidatus Uhrbacteria bacterium]